jgi:hypothetical protein
MSRTLCASFVLALVALSTSSAALAGDKYVVTISPSKVMRFDGTTGALLDPNFCDIDGLLGLGGVFNETREGVFLPNGELLVANWTATAIHRFSGDGSTYLGDIPTGARPSWLAVANDRLWVSEGNTNIVQYDLATFTVQSSTPMTNCRDVYLFNGELLVTEWNNLPIRRIDPATGNVIGDFASPGGSNYQMAALASGNLLVARWGPPGYHVLTAAGALVGTTAVGFGQPEGIGELGNGNYLIATQQGVRSWDPVGLTSTLVHAGPALSIFEAPAPTTIGTNYCAANVNSTGVTGSLIGSGSDVVVDNDFHLEASTLPLNAFGYFVTSQVQGFVQNPGGSSGNLCLGGSIGRFLQQIQNTGSTGGFTIQADLTAFPSPSSGGVPVAAGETWSFQAWHRDAIGGIATSNFTVGLEVLFR